MNPVDPRKRLHDSTDHGDGQGCWLWVGHKINDGYGRFRTGGKMTLAHRLAYELEHGPIPPGACVLHVCDTPACVRPSHLRLGSHADNMRDMSAKGRRRGRDTRGEKSPGAKLTAEQVVAIRRDAECLSRRAVARRYGICQQTVSHVVSRRTWAHVP